MSLRPALSLALQYASPPPQSEAATLMRVIDPLIAAMGYTPLDIDPESTATPGLRPDRTLLPDTDHEWYLEAKSWGVSLDDPRHLQQAVNYAHGRGKRWVVLTNGQLWRIYDDHITGSLPADRLVAEARLDDLEQMEQLLTALSKPSMMSGLLGQFAIRARVRATLTRQLKDEGSEAIKTLLQLVKRQPGLSGVTRRDIADYFQDLQAAVQPIANLPAAGSSPQSSPSSSAPGSSIATSQAKPIPQASPASNTVPLDQAMVKATGSKPAATLLPDGTNLATTSWREIAVKVLEWVATHKSLPDLPFRGGERGGRFFLNITPNHKSAPMHDGYRALQLNGQTIYVDLHRSAVDILGRLNEVCRAADVDPASVKIQLQS